MANQKLESVIIDVIPHPDTRTSKNWWIVSPNEYVSDNEEGRVGDSQEIEGKTHAIRQAKLLARMYVDTGWAGRATISIDGNELTTYVAKKSRSGKLHTAPGRRGGKARHAPERSRLRPFGTHCAHCKRPLSGTEHVWHLGGGEYVCDRCRGATGGGKKRHGGKWYVGPRLDRERKFEPFMAARTPTQASHGKKYGHVIGPFRTKGGAVVMARFGAGNPHLQTVSEAEKMAKVEKAAGTLDLLMAEVKTMLKG